MNEGGVVFASSGRAPENGFSIHIEIELRRCPHLVFAVITGETHLWAKSDADEDARELRSSVSKLNPNHACEN